MKKLLFLSLIVWFSIFASAQKIHFTDSYNSWLTQGVYATAYNVRSSNDTGIYVINGISYIRQFFGYYETGFGFFNHYFFREDTVAGKVYYFSWQDSLEHVLYNYNLHAGDTISFDYVNPPYIDSVISVDSTLINGVYHKVFSLYETNPYYNYANPYYTYVEGIGGINQPLNVRLFYRGNGWEKLTCFQQNGIAPVLNIPYLDSSGMRSFTNCFSTMVATTSSKEAEIFPNPVTTELTITAPNKITEITITNLIGQTIYTQKCSAEKITVNVANLPAGVYMVKINGTDVRKFIKE